MLEAGESLRTWALEEVPKIGSTIPAEQLPDHRMDYLTYEGPVSNDRGTVTRWDWGGYALNSENDEQICITLFGRRLACEVVLERSSNDPQRWIASLKARNTSAV